MKSKWLLGAIVAVGATAAAFVLMWRFGTGSLLRPPPAPIQNLTFERVVLHPNEIVADVRNGGPDEINIAQVLVDEAYWQFTASPGPRLGRLDSATVRIPYPWVEGEPVGITVVDATGTTFGHEIAAAAETPEAGGRAIAGYVLLGTYAGVIPVFLGLLFLPALSRLGERGFRFLLGLTAGLLGFLAIDALVESIELTEEIAEPFQGSALVVAGVAASLGALVFVSRRLRGRGTTPLAVAYLIAIGIGLHNFGEGLAIGSAQAVGAVALGTFLVIGFAIHNLTEGIGIVAPTVRNPPRAWHLLVLGAIAGLPTIAGTLLGGFAYSPVAATFLLAVGVGAIVQVVIELARIVRREAGVLAGPWVGGIAAGFAVMYATGLLIKS